MTSKKFVTSWSGGKDSCFAFMKALKSGMTPVALLNVLNEQGKISRSHGIPKNILKQQAQVLGLPLIAIPSSWQEYEMHFVAALRTIKSTYSIDAAVFGDIDLQGHRDWEEKVCGTAGLEALLPLWQGDRKELVIQMIAGGIEAYIVSCNEVMGENFLGRKIDERLIAELETLDVDPCGENGEYHTLVTDAPQFKNPLDIKFGERMKHENYWFVEMTTAKENH